MRTPRPVRTPLLAMLIALASLSAHAQEACRDDDTVTQCLERNILQARGFAAKVVQSADKTAADQSQPGAQSGGNQVSSTVTDLIPWLNMLGVLSNSDASDGTLAIDLNFLLPAGTGPAGHNSQLKWILNVNPEPFTPLVDAFPDAVRDARKSALKSKLNDTADSELRFSWSLVTDRFGRDFRRNHEAMVTMLAPTIAAALRTRDQTARLDYMREFGDLIADAPFADQLPPNMSSLKFNDPRLTPAVRESLKRLVARYGTELGVAQKPVAATLQNQLQAAHLTSLSQLVLQQPQLLFSATRRFRNALVGPDAWGAKVTYEHSFANFGDFMRKNRSACGASRLRTASGEPASLSEAAECYAALGNYLEDHASSLDNEDRLSVSLEYRKVDSALFSFPADGVALSVPKTDRLIGSVGYGRALPRGGAADRVDFKGDYDSNISGKAGGKSRVVVSLTYTRRIMGMDVPFGLVYANKSEFLEGVDRQLSLHVGVKFKAAAPAE